MKMAENVKRLVQTPVKCPVCGEFWFDDEHDLDICPICNWSNDEHQLRDPDLKLTNQMSLNEAREAYKNGKPIY